MQGVVGSLRRYGQPLLAVVALITLVGGGIGHFTPHQDWASGLWSLGTGLVLSALVVEIVLSLMQGRFGLDVIAGLSMGAALVFGEPLAGNIVALMYAGGQQLENFAEGRARREMTALLGRTARTAMRYAREGLEEVPIETLMPGERILIRHGEVVPVDGRLSGDRADIDMSALTGEAMPARFYTGDDIPSGGTSIGAAFDLDVVRAAADSTYAGIVRLVEQAQQSKAPMVRLADRYALWFLALTVVIAGGAWWGSGDPLRALAVLVVATPCPLILAVPVAIISGMSRAASLGVLIKSGGALEALARVRTAVLDKTGTMTSGKAGVVEIRTVDGIEPEEMLRLAASLDQASNHVSAEALVQSARERGMALLSPTNIVETPGSGVEGKIDGRSLVVGGSDFVRGKCSSGNPYDLGHDLPPGTAVVAVGIDGVVAGIILLSDRIREDAHSTVAAFRAAGVTRFVMASGDHVDAVRAAGNLLGVEEALGNLLPAQKVELVIAERLKAPVMMIGDGVNDAPALAAADVGVAMGARGAAASSESADVVLLVDHLARLPAALMVAQRTRRIAMQSVAVGLSLSLLAMVAAAFGYLPPVEGALLQELIDVAVILNALRALRVPVAVRSPRQD
ncbi:MULTISPECIES: heavy metal translocating P-type ATPase [Alphaproteobacteria]|uniref:P-type Zn(2+) transporter n=2 Tax=Alphaproteobacteria TaxID=28211 RepID=A0A512HK08_9HYPH|nr:MULTISPECIES: heavy metal translocating P-type ATPase [Alphaproteobacteria]GEO85787.1 cation transporter [Ciceribacter naphthalenivorans]GLR21853.1 cation transporter [Ciceribacter naphthalenivorans]GLT04709.1 cation transporter [Sphingomonas psychrolutea]